MRPPFDLFTRTRHGFRRSWVYDSSHPSVAAAEHVAKNMVGIEYEIRQIWVRGSTAPIRPAHVLEIVR